MKTKTTKVKSPNGTFTMFNFKKFNSFPIQLLTVFSLFISFQSLNSQCSNEALNFDGIDDFVAGLLPNTYNDITLSAWFNASSIVNGASEDRIFSISNPKIELGLEDDAISTDEGKLWIFDEGYGGTIVFPTANLHDDTWHHVVFKRFGAERKIFLDGVLIHTWTGNTIGFNGSIVIGNRQGFNGEFKGLIDEVAFYDTALSDLEITTNWNCELSGSEANLIGYWPFENGTPNSDNTSLVSTPDESIAAVIGDCTLGNLALNGSSSNFVCPPNEIIYSTAACLLCTDDALAVIEGDLQLPVIGTSNSNSEVLTIDGCGIVSKSNFSALDQDSDPLNEIQDISLNGNDLSITNGSTISLPTNSEVSDQDNDTYMDVESSPDIDEINFTIGGTENFIFKKNNGNAYLGIKNSTNTIIGEDAGLNISSTTMHSTFIGKNAGKSITSGTNNTFIGENAGQNIQTQNENVAIGTNALGNSVNGYRSVAIGNGAIEGNNGSYNVALGRVAGWFSTEGSNTFIGDQSGSSLIDGKGNTLIGRNAGYILTEGDDNVALGFDAGTVLSSDILNNTVAIGRNARVTSDHQICIGNTSTLEIGGYQDWTVHSDSRIKNNVTENVIGLNFINKLRPVSYNVDYHKLSHMLQETNPQRSVSQAMADARTLKSQKTDFGFIAQEVSNTLKELKMEFQGVNEPTTPNGLYKISYASFVVPLVKAVQELDSENSLLEKKNQELKTELENIKKRIEAIEKKITK